MKKLPPILGMLILLAVAYAFDRLIEGARTVAAAPLSVVQYQWLVLIANLVFAACVLGLGWLVLHQREKRAQAAVLLVAGLVIILLPTPPFWTLGANFSGPLFTLLQASPHSLFGEAGAFLVVMSLAALFLPGSDGQARAAE